VNDSGSNKWWLFWAVVIALAGILVYSLTGFPKTGIAKNENIKPSVKKTISTSDKRIINKLLDSNKNIPTDAEKLIAFTKKTVCRRNVQIINTMIEFWNVKHEGLWPRNDLSDIGKDKDYFPRGVPVCPVDGSPYRLDSLSHRVIGHEHSDIKFDYKEIDGLGAELR
jgi:hypothetical protein